MKTGYCVGSFEDEDRPTNTQRLPITKSLSLVFDTIWANQKCQEDKTAWFWVDALCINQESNAEKSYQVALMDKIYLNSARVWVCLGEPDEASEIAMPFVKLMANAMTISKIKGIGCYGTWTRAQKSDLKFPTDTHILGKHVRAYFRLLRREWFRRVWIIQEYCLPRHAIMMCGSHKVLAEELYQASIYCSAASLSTAFAIDWADPRAVVDLHMTRQERDNPQKPDLRTLLARYRKAASTNPRDKIYALVGLCCDWKLDTKNVLEEPGAQVWTIKPDYDEFVGNVFMNFAMAWMRRYENLNVLQFISNGRTNNLDLNKKAISYYYVKSAFDEQGHLLTTEATTTTGVYAPTWVPDWSQVNTTNTLQGYHFGYESPELYPENRREEIMDGTAPEKERDVHLVIYNACGKHASYNLDQNMALTNMILQVEGRRVDTIGEMGETFFDTDVVPKNWQIADLQSMPYIYFKDLKRIEKDATLFDIFGQTPYFNGDSRFETLFHCYTAGHANALDSNGRQKALAEFKEFIDDYERMSAYAKTFSEPGLPQNLARIHESHVKTCNNTRDVFMQKALVALKGRRVFKTPGNSRAGFYGFCGLGPDDMQEGDVIYILKGCNVPMVLRQHYGQQWTVVGECYVHGIMHGEAISDSTKFETLHLI